MLKKIVTYMFVSLILKIGVIPAFNTKIQSVVFSVCCFCCCKAKLTSHFASFFSSYAIQTDAMSFVVIVKVGTSKP